MTFAKAREIDGQKDEKGYQVKVDMFGKLMGVKPSEFNRKGHKEQQVAIQDDLKETNQVKIMLGKNPDLTELQVGQRLSFKVGTNPFQGIMYYNGFWNSQVKTNQTPQSTPQAAYTPQGSTNAPKGGVTGLSDVEMRLRLIERLLPTIDDLDLVYPTITKMMDFIKTGKVPYNGNSLMAEIEAKAGRTEPEYTGEQETPDNEEIPF